MYLLNLYLFCIKTSLFCNEKIKKIILPYRRIYRWIFCLYSEFGMVFQGSNYRQKFYCQLPMKNPSKNLSLITDKKSVEKFVVITDGKSIWKSVGKFVVFRKWVENLQRKNPSVTGKNPSINNFRRSFYRRTKSVGNRKSVCNIDQICL